MNFKALEAWKQRARQIKTEVHAIYLACRDPRVPWYARAFGACVVGYAFCPIDPIPDFIPILGYLDELILLPLGIVLLRKMIPAPVLAECQEKAQAVRERPKNWVAAAVVIVVWLLLATLGILLIGQAIGDVKFAR